tara:strand:+ start:1759 stop:1944 length:186 start_codon:yes stop_codon:yes gene_type:complete
MTVEFITRDDMAERLKIGKRTVDAWTYDKILPSYKIGGTVRYDWLEIVELIKKNVKVQKKV